MSTMYDKVTEGLVKLTEKKMAEFLQFKIILEVVRQL